VEKVRKADRYGNITASRGIIESDTDRYYSFHICFSYILLFGFESDTDIIWLCRIIFECILTS
jgi:hypothetical protein